MKHFETLYEESEKLFANINANDSLDVIIDNIIQELRGLSITQDKLKQIECLGRAMYYISGLSNKQKINVYTALNETLEDLKLEAYDLGMKR